MVNVGINNASGVTAPSAIKVSLSQDGENWSAATDLTIPENPKDNSAFFVEGEVIGNARYVKIDVELGVMSFVFLNEIEVYGHAAEPSDDPIQPAVALGDVNNDGAVNQYDYILIKRHYFTTRVLSENEMSRADVNKDGKVDQYDYILVARHYFGTFVIK